MAAMVLNSPRAIQMSVYVVSEVVWVMTSNYRANRGAVDDIVEGLLTAPQLMIEKADIVWRALKAYRDSKADFSAAVVVELGSGAGYSKTVTFDRNAAAHPGSNCFDKGEDGSRRRNSCAEPQARLIP